MAFPQAGVAQSGGPVEVVQPTPGPEVASLNAALTRLANNPRSVDALIDAGTAALDVGDVDAAIGFFGRADELSPGNPRAKMGMAAGFMRSDRPIDALRLFAEAERAGASAAALAGDRGLAFDLVGDNAHAQEQYRSALARRDDPAIVRRLALSQAIAGDRRAFEQTLLPLLQKRDLAAYRTRAFGLAILNETKEAQQITDAVMPKQMAAQVRPYLDYMPQLTKAQQAAAANLGRFPQASRIGRDDPQMAQYATSSSPAVRQAGSNLEPRGVPLGQPAVAASSQAPTPTQPQQASSPTPQQPAVQAPPTGQGNLARVVAQQGAPAPEKPKQQSINQAFSDFSLPTASSASASSSDAVDITRIRPRREVIAPPPPKHPERIWVQVATGRDLDALNFDWRRLSRQSPELLGKFSPHTVAWGAANRLLAGPFASASAARDAVNALKSKGIDSFTYTSPEGQAIADLD